MSLVTPSGPWPTAATLALLRARIGLPPGDTTKDAELTAAWAMVTSWVETYLDRWLVPGAYEEVFTHVARKVLSLKAYPVIAITEFLGDVGTQVVDYHVEKPYGLVHMDGFVISHELTVLYDALPDVDGPIMLAMLSVFDSVWRDLSATEPSGGDGPVKAISSNGARVEFDLSAGGMDIDAGSGLPTSVAYMLNLYRRQSC
jgi:hypothetical protein